MVRQVSAGREGGQALVEFALVLPLLLVLVLGIIKFGILFNNYITLTNAVVNGARTLATNRGAGTGPPTACTLASTAITNAAVNLNTSQITIPTPSFSGSGGSTCSGMVAGDTATMKATYPCDLTILGVNFAPSCTLTSQTTVRIE